VTAPVKGTGEFLHVFGALQHGIRSYLVPAPISASLAQDGAARRRRQVERLTRREREVLSLVADGQQNKAVGDALRLSPLTVKSVLSRAGQKLGVGERAGMVGAALRAGIIR
jgi:DNA-binding NarL/FixJ family response regulator